MKNVFRIVVFSFLLISCDDGDLIVTDFNFENKKLQWCEDSDTQVLFNLNNDLVHEAIAFRFSLNNETSQFLTTQEGVTTIPLSANNQIIYRVFDSQIESSYFCNAIPPVSPKVVEEYRTTSGGEVLITTSLVNNTDHDGDGVLSSQEGMSAEKDTDLDGIPDYLDIDDDGDNIPTRIEIEVAAENTVNNLPDSDNDGTPDFLDNDDDNDGTLTRNEDWNMNNNPADDRNADGVPHYLNPAITDFFENTNSRENTISRAFRYVVTVENLTLSKQGGDGEQIRLENYELGYYDSPIEQITLEPATSSGEAQ